MFPENRYTKIPIQGGLIWQITPAIMWIIIANISIYLIELITFHWLQIDDMIMELAISPDGIFPRMKIWQLITYMWLHDPTSPGHLILNMFGLWMFGTLLEEKWGSKGFVKFYILCGIAAGFCVFIAGKIFGSDNKITMGASGGIYAIIIAFGILMPHIRIYFLGLLPIKAIWMVYITIGATLLYWLAKTPGISVSAHVGGMIAGGLWTSGWWNPWIAYKSIKIIYLRRKIKLLKKEKKHSGDDTPIYH